MFYYPDVLIRHVGCFSTIWLAATKGTKITRREYLKVNVIRTCDDIMDYVMVRVLPPRPGLPRPRLSLYLSSQLQYGVVLVYHYQCKLLLEEIQMSLEKLAKKRTSQMADIDVPDRGAGDVSLSDPLTALEETEWAADPMFGVMHLGDPVPSPGALMQGGFGRHSSTEEGEWRGIQLSQEHLRGVSPERLLTSPVSRLPDGLTASRDAITLTEKEPHTMPTAGSEPWTRTFPLYSFPILDPEPGGSISPNMHFEGMELDYDPNLIDLLLGQPDDFPDGEEKELKRSGGEEEVERMKEITADTMELQATLSSQEALLPEEAGPPGEKPAPLEEERTPVSAPLPPPLCTILKKHNILSWDNLKTLQATLSSQEALLPEEAGPPGEKPAPLEEERTPVSAPLPPHSPPGPEEVEDGRRRKRRSPNLEELPPLEKKGRKRGRRQLLFVDLETQLSPEEFQQQIADPLTETRDYPPPPRTLSPAHLLHNPCTHLPEEILSLWRRAAAITPLSGSDLRAGGRGPDSTDSERPGERDVEEGEKPEERDMEKELTSKEVARELSEPDMAPPEVSGPLDISASRRHSGMISPVHGDPDTPQSKRSVSRPDWRASRLEGILEEGECHEDQAEDQVQAEGEPAAYSLLRAPSSGTLPELGEDDAPVLFHSLLPPQADRRTVTNTFWSLLEHQAVGIYCVEQDQPYGDIRISAGPNVERQAAAV